MIYYFQRHLFPIIRKLFIYAYHFRLELCNTNSTFWLNLSVLHSPCQYSNFFPNCWLIHEEANFHLIYTVLILKTNSWRLCCNEGSFEPRIFSLHKPDQNYYIIFLKCHRRVNLILILLTFYGLKFYDSNDHFYHRSHETWLDKSYLKCYWTLVTYIYWVQIII